MRTRARASEREKETLRERGRKCRPSSEAPCNNLKHKLATCSYARNLQFCSTCCSLCPRNFPVDCLVLPSKPWVQERPQIESIVVWRVILRMVRRGSLFKEKNSCVRARARARVCACVCVCVRACQQHCARIDVCQQQRLSESARARELEIDTQSQAGRGRDRQIQTDTDTHRASE